VGNLGRTEATDAAADLKMLALKVAWLERQNDVLRHRLKRIESLSRLDVRNG
jgi:hypothetical protein